MEPISMEEYAGIVGIPIEDLRGRSRKEPLVIAREVYWYYLNKSGLGYRRISKLDGRCPETIYSGIKTIRNLIETDHPLVDEYQDFISRYVKEAK